MYRLTFQVGLHFPYRLIKTISLGNKRKQTTPKRIVRVADLVSLPKRDIVPKKRVAKSSLPSWHLTSKETMEYIKGAHSRAQEKEEKKEKKENIAKTAIREAAKKERVEKKKLNKNKK